MFPCVFICRKNYRWYSNSKVVHGHDVPVLDAHGLQLVEQARLTQVAVEPVAGLEVLEVDVGNKALQPGSLHTQVSSNFWMETSPVVSTWGGRGT